MVPVPPSAAVLGLCQTHLPVLHVSSMVSRFIPVLLPLKDKTSAQVVSTQCLHANAFEFAIMDFCQHCMLYPSSSQVCILVGIVYHNGICSI